MGFTSSGVLRLTLLLFCLLMAPSSTADSTLPAEIHRCTVFLPQECAFEVPHPGRRPELPACMRPCKFNSTARLQCPFWSKGLFASEPATTQSCATPHLVEVERPWPGCEAACCSTDLQGNFVPDPEYEGHLVFQPLANVSQCTYRQYTRREILRLFQGQDLVFAGDSMTRQLVVRFIHLMRGQEVIVDHRIHTHISYATCDSIDEQRLGPYDRGFIKNFTQLNDTIPTFFKSGPDFAEPPWSGCNIAPMQVQYMFSVYFSQQTDFLRRYLTEGQRDPPRRATLFVNVGYWTKLPDVPPEYLQVLEEVLPQLEALYVVATATRRGQPSHNPFWQRRNEAMHRWAQGAGPKVHYLDFDLISQSKWVPSAAAGGNKHYACFLNHPPHPIPKHPAGNLFQDRIHGSPIGNLFPSEDKRCWDDMNLSLWNVILGAAMGDAARRSAASDQPAVIDGGAAAPEEEAQPGSQQQEQPDAEDISPEGAAAAEARAGVIAEGAAQSGAAADEASEGETAAGASTGGNADAALEVAGAEERALEAAEDAQISQEGGGGGAGGAEAVDAAQAAVGLAEPAASDAAVVPVGEADAAPADGAEGMGGADAAAAAAPAADLESSAAVPDMAPAVAEKGLTASGAAGGGEVQGQQQDLHMDGEAHEKVHLDQESASFSNRFWDRVWTKPYR